MQDALGNTTTYQSEYNDPTKEFFSKNRRSANWKGQRVQEDYHNRQGRLKRQVVNGKTQVDIKYDTINRVDYITNVRGFTTQIERDEFENIKSITHPDGSKQSYTYSPVHLGLTKSVDPLGIETQYQRDDKGNLIKRIEAQALLMLAPPLIPVTTKGKSLPLPTKVAMATLTVLGRWATMRQGILKRWQIRKDIKAPINMTVWATSPFTPMAMATVRAISMMRQVTYYRKPMPMVIPRSINMMIKALAKAIDENGNATDYQYDLAGRLTGITHAEGGTYRISYNGQGQAVKETDEDGRSTEIRYDNFLRMQAHKDGKGNVTSYNYNLTDGNPGSLSAPTETTYPTFKVQQRYDNMERPTTQTVLNPTEQGTEGLITNNKYDKRGQLIETPMKTK